MNTNVRELDLEKGRIADTHYETSLEVLEDSKLAGSQQHAKTDYSTLGCTNTSRASK